MLARWLVARTCAKKRILVVMELSSVKVQQQNLLSGERGTCLLFGRVQKKDAEQAHDGISMSASNSLHCEDLEPGEVHEVTLILT